MEPRTGESMKTFSKASGTNQKSVSSKESKDLRSLASAQEYRDACYKRGDFDSCVSLGRLEYHRGKKDACHKRGDLEACIIFGGAKEMEGNLDEAATAYGKACDGGNTNGCLWLGNLEQLKRGNLDEAAAAYEKGCDEGDPSNCLSLGMLEAKRGNPDAAETAYEKACDKIPDRERYKICTH